MNLHRALSRAKRIEDSLRERAFLPVTENINGVTVKQLTLRHFIILLQLKSPFVSGGPRRIEDVGQFLWVVSPQYDADDPEGLERYVSELVFHPTFHLFYRAIDYYIFYAFMDRPPKVEGGKLITASYAASMIHRVAKIYRESRETILDTPLSALFQFIKWIDAEQTPNAPQFTPLQSRVERTAERLRAKKAQNI